MILDEKLQRVINNLLKDFELHPYKSRYMSTFCLNDTEYRHPVWFHFWSPIEKFKLSLHCARHGAKFVPLKWASDVLHKKRSDNPRLLYCLEKNVIFIQRLYKCSSKRSQCFFRSVSKEFLDLLSDETHKKIEFKLYIRSGFSYELIDFIFEMVAYGKNFTELSKMISEKRVVDQLDTDDVLKDITTSFPSQGKIAEVFLDVFQTRKAFYSETIYKAVPEQFIEVYRSLKIGKTIGGFDNNKLVKHDMKLMIAFDEKSRVVAWKLINYDAGNESSSKEFTETLDCLRKRINTLDYIIANCCCEDTILYHSVFGPVDVKLNLSCALLPISELFRKSSKGCYGFLNDLSLAFRISGDDGEYRCFPTADKCEVLENINNVFEKHDVFIKSLPFTRFHGLKEKMEELKKHVMLDCLSNISAAHQPESNELIHSLLKGDFFKGPFVGHELLTALLTVIFHHYNTKINKTVLCTFDEFQSSILQDRDQDTTENEIVSDQQVVVSSLIAVEMSPSLPEQKSENEEIGSNPPEIRDIIKLETNDCTDPSTTSSPNEEDVTSSTAAKGSSSPEQPGDSVHSEAGQLISIAFQKIQSMMNTFNELKKLCKNRSFSTEALLINNLKVNVYTQDEPNGGDEKEHKKTLQENLVWFQLQIRDTQKDGDSCFRSILMQVYSQLKQCNDDEDRWKSYMIIELQLSLEDLHEDITKLRELFVTQIESNSKPQYKDILIKSNDVNNINGYRKDVTPNIARVVLDACANILKVPIIVVLSTSHLSVQCFLPSEQLHDKPLFVAFDRHDGNYSATVLVSGVKENKETAVSCFCRSGCNEDNKRKICPCLKNQQTCSEDCSCTNCKNNKTCYRPPRGCRCGSNAKKHMACSNEDRSRKSKCPCLRSKMSCVNCQCHGCSNPFGKKNPQSHRKRKLPNSAPSHLSYKRKPTEEYLREFDSSAVVWTFDESVVLYTCAQLAFEMTGTYCAVNIQQLYDVIAINHKLCPDMAIQVKTTTSIQKKLRIMDFIS